MSENTNTAAENDKSLEELQALFLVSLNEYNENNREDLFAKAEWIARIYHAAHTERRLGELKEWFETKADMKNSSARNLLMLHKFWAVDRERQAFSLPAYYFSEGAICKLIWACRLKLARDKAVAKEAKAKAKGEHYEKDLGRFSDLTITSEGITLQLIGPQESICILEKTGSELRESVKRPKPISRTTGTTTAERLELKGESDLDRLKRDHECSLRRIEVLEDLIRKMGVDPCALTVAPSEPELERQESAISGEVLAPHTAAKMERTNMEDPEPATVGVLAELTEHSYTTKMESAEEVDEDPRVLAERISADVSTDDIPGDPVKPTFRRAGSLAEAGTQPALKSYTGASGLW